MSLPIYSLFFIFQDSILVGSPGWSQTFCLSHSSRELQLCVTMPDWAQISFLPFPLSVSVSLSTTTQNLLLSRKQLLKRASSGRAALKPRGACVGDRGGRSSLWGFSGHSLASPQRYSPSPSSFCAPSCSCAFLCSSWVSLFEVARVSGEHLGGRYNKHVSNREEVNTDRFKRSAIFYSYC